MDVLYGEDILERILPLIEFIRGGLTRPERRWLEQHLKGKVVVDRKDLPSIIVFERESVNKLL